MLSLNDRKWLEFEVKDIFDITQGRKWITKAEITNNPGDVPLVSCAETNNGIMGYVNPDGMPKATVVSNVITIAVSGSAGAANYQENKTVINSGVLILNGKEFSSRHTYLFMLVPLRANGVKYNYGLKASQDRVSTDKIRLPITPEGKPDYDFMEQYIRERAPDYSWVTKSFAEYDRSIDWNNIEEKINRQSEDLGLQSRKWEEFKIEDLFTIEQGKGKINKDDVSDNFELTPIATASTINNGILGYSDKQQAKIRKGNTITVGRQTGIAFYQPKEYFETDNILILSNDNINKSSGLFIVSLFNSHITPKISYGRIASIGKLKSEYIQLPITDKGNPDYEYMERFVVRGISLTALEFKKVLTNQS